MFPLSGSHARLHDVLGYLRQQNVTDYSTNSFDGSVMERMTLHVREVNVVVIRSGVIKIVFVVIE